MAKTKKRSLLYAREEEEPSRLQGRILTLAMKINPPAIKQKEETSSDGGRDGRIDVGGERYMVRYVTARASEKLTKRTPHYVMRSKEVSRGPS